MNSNSNANAGPDEQRLCRDASNRVNRTQNRFLRAALVTAGTFFVGLAILGIFLPLLPTTCFLILAAACYARSSERFYNWLLNNRWFGRYVRNYLEKKGVPLRAKLLSISLLWITILFSATFVVDNLIVRIILILIAISVTIHIVRIPTLRLQKKKS
jgi:uncharacterized membrane protein YbaN (DUF454 family)